MSRVPQGRPGSIPGQGAYNSLENFKMTKKGKLATPEWITEGFDSKADWEKKHEISSEKKKGKTFNIRECPKCGSDEVSVTISGSDAEEDANTGREWECKKCKWKGKDIVKKELSEDEFMKYLDEKGEQIP